MKMGSRPNPVKSAYVYFPKVTTKIRVNFNLLKRQNFPFVYAITAQPRGIVIVPIIFSWLTC